MRRGRGCGQGFRGFVSAEGPNLPLSIYDGTRAAAILPPPHPPGPHAAASTAPPRPPPPPASPATDHHGPGHHAGQAGRRDREEPVRRIEMG